MNGVDQDLIRMRLFPLSLRDKARGWLQSLQPGNISTWEELAQKFLTKFFPPSKTSQLRGKIAQFRQLDFEPLYKSWERLKDLIRKCPQHEYQDWFQIQLFYNGLDGQIQTIVNVAAGGTLLSKTAEETYALLEEMACNNYQWPSERLIRKRVAGVHEVDQMAALSAEVAALSNQIKNFTTREASSSQDKAMAASSSCVDDGFKQEQCQYINNQNYNFRLSNNLPTHYHPELCNHENVSYDNAKISEKEIGAQFSKFLEMFRKLHFNIPFMDALEQMSNYLKFIKEVMSKKRCLEEYEMVKLTEESSFIIQRKLPKKEKDPGSFTIPCTIGKSNFERALCDLGASINLMPLSIFWKLRLGEVKLTTISLQMADRSITYP
ncbi:DNA-directed DNA polymerase [Melia azedarach]|uniref:DNA-directed DNA polymerase n=1 Tax=Melia azedarach TaxID=155640 RepID=A0ACC1X1V2_MELAZ|nr:DNA-directed DNA polymerase [Melia azedarach]